MAASTHHPILVGPSSERLQQATSREAPSVAHVAPSTFDEAYRAHFPFVWRSAKRLGVSDASLDDVVQEVFLIVHRRLGGFEGRSSLRTWLFGITLRVVRDHRRASRRRDPGPAVDPDTLGATGPGPGEDAQKAEAVRLLHALLDELPDERREIFVMAELEQISIPDIAEALAINVNTAYGRLRIARQEFELALQRHRARDAARDAARGAWRTR